MEKKTYNRLRKRKRFSFRTFSNSFYEYRKKNTDRNSTKYIKNYTYNVSASLKKIHFEKFV